MSIGGNHSHRALLDWTKLAFYLLDELFGTRHEAA
jgi:hypothetical protein